MAWPWCISQGSLEEQNHIYDYKKGFIRLAYTIWGWMVPLQLSAHRELDKTVAAQSKKLEASEQERLVMWSCSKAEGLEAWRVTGVNLHWKSEKDGIWCPWVMAESLRKNGAFMSWLASSFFHFCSIQVPGPHSGQDLPAQWLFHIQVFSGNTLTNTPRICFSNHLGLSVQSS
jgi:hypothetical protein